MLRVGRFYDLGDVQSGLGVWGLKVLRLDRF